MLVSIALGYFFNRIVRAKIIHQFAVHLDKIGPLKSMRYPLWIYRGWNSKLIAITYWLCMSPKQGVVIILVPFTTDWTLFNQYTNQDRRYLSMVWIKAKWPFLKLKCAYPFICSPFVTVLISSKCLLFWCDLWPVMAYCVNSLWNTWYRVII